MKRTAALIGVGISAICGLALIGTCAWFIAVVGPDGVTTTPLGTITSTARARAVVIGVDEVLVHGPLSGLGRVEFVASSPDRTALAVAAGEGTIVDARLDGVAYDAASVDGTTWTTAAVPGGTRMPTWDAGDWQRLSVGAAPALPVSGGQVVVLGRADGRSGITADVALSWRADRVAALVSWVIVAGVLLLVVAAAMGWLVVRRR